MAPCKAAVFDLGGVLIHWDPRLLYRKMLPTEEAVERFLATVCTPEWNARQDAGRPLDEGIADLVARFPDQASLIEAWRDRLTEMVRPIRGSAEIVRDLREREVPLYVLSNWGTDEFEIIRDGFTFLEGFQGILLSGEVGILKPDPGIFDLLLQRHRLHPAKVAFIDDHIENVEAAQRLGFEAILFTSPADLRGKLGRLGLL